MLAKVTTSLMTWRKQNFTPGKKSLLPHKLYVMIKYRYVIILQYNILKYSLLKSHSKMSGTWMGLNKS